MFNSKVFREMRSATDFGSILKNAIQAKETVPSRQDNSPTRVVGQIQRKYRRKQLEHLPLSTTARPMLILSFSMAVKYLLYPRNLRFPAGTLRKSPLKTNAADGMPVIA